MTADEVIAEMDALVAQPVVDFHAYRNAKKELLALLVEKAVYLMATWDDPLSQQVPCRPHLVWASDRPHEIRIANVELLDSAFGHWNLEGLTAPSTDHRPC